MKFELKRSFSTSLGELSQEPADSYYDIWYLFNSVFTMLNPELHRKLTKYEIILENL